MTINENTTSIIQINSHKGVDGSTAITAIPDGYCEQMENCDISTAEAISKRAGYQVYAGTPPVKLLDMLTDNVTANTKRFLNQTYIGGLGSGCVFLPYNNTTLTTYIDQYKYLQNRTLTDFCIVKLSTSFIITEAVSLQKGDYLITNGVGLGRIRDVLGGGYYVLGRGDYNKIKANGYSGLPLFDSLVSTTISLSGIALMRGLSFNEIVESDVTSITKSVSPTNEYTLRVSLDVDIYPQDLTYLPVLSYQGIVQSVTKSATYQDVVVRFYTDNARTVASTVDFTLPYFQMMFTGPSMSFALYNDFKAPSDTYVLIPEEYVPVHIPFQYWISDNYINLINPPYSTTSLINQPSWAWGLNVNSKNISSVDEFYSLNEEDKVPVHTASGVAYKLFTKGTASATLKALTVGVLSAGTYNAGNGT